MIFLLFGVLGLGLAAARRVPLARLASVRFSAIWAVFAAAALHVVLNPLVLPPDLASRLLAAPLPGLPATGGLLYIFSLLLALLFLVLNRSLPGITLISAGLGLNLIVIAANGGQMPGDPTPLARAGLLQGMLDDLAAGRWSYFAIMRPDTPLCFLGDVFLVPLPFREPTILSIGDFVILAGELLFFNPINPLRERWPARVAGAR